MTINDLIKMEPQIAAVLPIRCRCKYEWPISELKIFAEVPRIRVQPVTKCACGAPTPWVFTRGSAKTFKILMREIVG